MEVVQNKCFGTVITVETFSGEEKAIKLANDLFTDFQVVSSPTMSLEPNAAPEKCAWEQYKLITLFKSNH